MNEKARTFGEGAVLLPGAPAPLFVGPRPPCSVRRVARFDLDRRSASPRPLPTSASREWARRGAARERSFREISSLRRKRRIIGKREAMPRRGGANEDGRESEHLCEKPVRIAGPARLRNKM
ncbi:hypothetical protein KM043_001403 [Ampulex compressa]|nr:hypothetical protein KM043_001403 [Ampulex compressa]